MRKFISTAFLIFLSFPLFAQNHYTLTGTVTDTVNMSPTQYTSVSLIRAADSVLETFGRADADGKFTVQTDSAGKYILLLEHPNFASYTDLVEISKAHTDLGEFPMISRKQLLQEVIISGQQAITIKGDTVEFNADSFKTRQFDNVDELLKKLPGLEVSSDGTIKAYGQEVKKMLVDGEEFFSDDPAMVAKTLRASAVDKVQVFDKKSDEAEFTGIDDGEKIKTINLKLKDEAKKGYFGKMSAGAGLPGYWENQAMINAFKKKRKISLYGIMSNTNKSGLDWDESNKYGSGNNFSVNDDGDFVSTSTNTGFSDWGGNYSGQGIPRTWTAGAHYSNKWYGDTLSFNGSYNYAKQISEAFNNRNTRYILPDTQYFNTSNSESTTQRQRHGLNAEAEYKIDSLSSIRLTLGGSYGISESNSEQHSEARSLSGALINENNQEQSASGQSQNVNASLYYKKKFKKKGRSFSANFSGNQNENQSDGFQRSDYTLYVIDTMQQINQRKSDLNTSLNFDTRLTYTEPLSEKMFLIFNYGLALNNQESNRKSFDVDNTVPESDEINPLYSSHYLFNTLANQGGINFRFNPSKKISFNFGGNISNTQFTQEDKMYDTTYRYSYLNFFPRLSFSFQKSQQSSLRFNYNGRSRQPSLTQLQPLRNNEDPLNIAIGNPDLKQEFSHRLSLNYYSYKVLTSQNMNFGANVSVTQNAISQKQTVDVNGKRTYQYVNVDGNYSSWAYASFGKKIVSDLRGYLSVNMNYSHTNSFINNLPNETNTFSITPSLHLGYQKDTSYSISYSFNPAYNNSVSSIRTDIKTKYWTFSQNFDGSIHLPAHFELGTNVDWNVRQRLNEMDKNNNVFLWNAYVSKSFLKDHSLVLKLYVNDLLNQNVGYSRFELADQISESTYNSIQRYFMLSLTWNFTKTGAGQPSGGGIIINSSDD
jgi:hypothetical protein